GVTVDDLNAEAAFGQREQCGDRHRQDVRAFIADEVDIHGSSVERAESLLVGDRHGHLDACGGGRGARAHIWAGPPGGGGAVWSCALSRADGADPGDLSFHRPPAGNRDGHRPASDGESPVSYLKLDGDSLCGAGVAEDRGTTCAHTASGRVADPG